MSEAFNSSNGGSSSAADRESGQNTLTVSDVCQSLAATVEESQSSGSVYSAALAVDFRFLHWAEWMRKGSKLVLRNLRTGRLGGVGFVY